MTGKHAKEFDLICDGPFRDSREALGALRLAFVEEFVEETGKYRYTDIENIRVTNRISLADVELEEVGEGRFLLSCRNAQVPLNRPKAEKLAENIRRMAIFDDVFLKDSDPDVK